MLTRTMVFSCAIADRPTELFPGYYCKTTVPKTTQPTPGCFTKKFLKKTKTISVAIVESMLP